MINKLTKIETDEYLNIFNKKFKNFMQKSPTKIDVIQVNDRIIIKDKYSEKSKSFYYDFTLDIKDFINKIKSWMVENLYPIMLEVKKEKINYSPEEIEQMIKKGIDVDEFLLVKKEKIIKTPYRLEKIILYSNNKIFDKKDRLFVRNLDTNIEALYELDMPGSIFLKNVLEKWNSEYAYQVFKAKSIYLNDIDPNFKKRN